VTYEFPLSQPWLTSDETRRVAKAIESGWLTQAGSEVKEMEAQLSNLTSSSNLIATSTSNGTTALHLALIAAGVRAGDEVIVPNFAYIAVVNSVLYCGATPVLIDVDLETWNIDINQIRTAITEKTKAIIVVDNYGRFADLKNIRSELPESISIICDSAESFPENFDKDLYSYANFLTTSFYGNKIFTSAEGGAVFGSEQSIKLIAKLKNHSASTEKKFYHDSLGYNYRITNIHAAIFSGQEEKK
jgi:perosamine synthetase